MDTAKFLSDLGKAVEVLQAPMTLEEAVYFTDPFNDYDIEKISKMPDSMQARNTLMIKARGMVVEYARKHMEAEKNE